MTSSCRVVGTLIQTERSLCINRYHRLTHWCPVTLVFVVHFQDNRNAQWVESLIKVYIVGIYMCFPARAHIGLKKYMHFLIQTSLVQVMAWCLSGAKPSTETVLTYCQLDPHEQTLVRFKSKQKHFHSGKCLKNVVCKMSDFVAAIIEWRPINVAAHWVFDAGRKTGD